VFDQEFVPHTRGTVPDSGAQVNILEGTLGSGTRIKLTGEFTCMFGKIAC
jgi:hypothetical protein